MRFCRHRPPLTAGMAGTSAADVRVIACVHRLVFKRGIGAALAFFDISGRVRAGTARGGCLRGRLCSV